MAVTGCGCVKKSSVKSKGHNPDQDAHKLLGRNCVLFQLIKCEINKQKRINSAELSINLTDFID